MKIFYHLHLKVEEFFGGLFDKYGRLIARHPWKAILFVAIVDIGFSIGLLKLERDNSTEQYVPKGSTASKDREKVYAMFQVDMENNFYRQSLMDFGEYATVIIQRKDGGNVVDVNIWNELVSLRNYVVGTNITYGGYNYEYTDICARRFSTCVIDGEYILGNEFIQDLSNGTIPYPYYSNAFGYQYNIRDTFGKPVAAGGFLTSAVAIRFTFNLDDSYASSDWQDAFLIRIKAYKSSILKLDFAHSTSLDDELYANISSDIAFFAVTFTLIITFAGLVLFGGNNVSNRYSLGMAGIASTGLAIIGSFGFVCLCGVPFASIVGTMPFLIIGIGVDDMFILLSGLADTSHFDDVETRIGKTMRTSGIAVTITSLTDVIAFCAGASSLFPAVKHFSLFTGTAILFCYLNYVTFFLGCMTINEKRVLQNRHFFTCRKTKSTREMMDAGISNVKIFWCAGSPHKHRDEVEGPLEKYPKRVIKKVVLFTPAKFIILLIFAGFVGVSIYGTVNFKEGLFLKDLVSTDSYFHSYQIALTSLYDQSFSISLNIQSGVNYRSNDTLSSINTLRDTLRADSYIDDKFFISWLHAYMTSPQYDNTSNANFTSGLTSFLSTMEGNMYLNDVTLNGDTIYATRFHILTENIISSSRQGKMMIRVREIVDASPLPVFAYSPTFFFIEQFVAIYGQTMQTLGICLAAVFVITAIFLPLPVMILFVTMTVVLIMISVIGFMHFWGLTLSSVTMIHIIMCIGFCVDFATHICHAFVQANGESRNERVGLAIDRSGGPVLNGGLSTIIGVLMLAVSKSFIFFSFFKVMFMVMAFGMMYALFLLPVLLSFFGPDYQHVDKKIDKRVSDEDIELKTHHKNSEDKNGNANSDGNNGTPMVFENSTFTLGNEKMQVPQHGKRLPPMDGGLTKKEKTKRRKRKKKKKELDVYDNTLTKDKKYVSG